MNRSWEGGQHLHGSPGACVWQVGVWALRHNVCPWQPPTAWAHGGWGSPAERLKQPRYPADGRQNLLVSASLGGYRR